MSDGNICRTDDTTDKKDDHVDHHTERTADAFQNPPDGGWGWVVTFCCFMISVIVDGISFSFGLLFHDLMIHFNGTNSLTSWIISAFNGTYLTVGPISSVLVNIFGCRKVAVFGAILSSVSLFLSTFSPNIQVMILLYGILGGFGIGLLYLPSIVSVGHYFNKKRALATGIAMCGSGIGGFAFAPLTEFLIERYTWEGTTWIMAAIVLNGIPIGALLRPLKSGEAKYQHVENDGRSSKSGSGHTTNSHETKKTKSRRNLSKMFDFNLLRSPTFIVYGLAAFLCMLGFFIPFTYIPGLANEFGMSSQQAALLISVIGILNTAGRVGFGWLADRQWTDALMINSFTLVIGGVANIFAPYYKPYWAMVIYCAVFGITIAVFVSYRTTIMTELLGIERLNSSLGLVAMCQGLASFIGTPIAGSLVDQEGNYGDAFYFAGATICLSGVLCFPLRTIRRWEKKRFSR